MAKHSIPAGKSSSGLGDFKDWLDSEGGTSSSPPIPIDISKFKDWTLEQIEGRLRNLQHEELFILDKDGKILAAYKGDSHSVGFPTDALDIDGATVTHGHPKSMADFGGTFSFADMKNMLKSNWAEHRATASGQGEMNYILRRTEKANSQGFYDQINRDYVRLKTQMSDKYSKSYNDAKNSGASKKSAMHKARQEAVGVLNAYYKRTSAKFGFEYIARKKAYTYNR